MDQSQREALMSGSDSLEGDINIAMSPDGNSSNSADEQTFNTLDEPVKDTIKRDLSAIGQKFLHVLYPKESKMLLHEWDLWGPLILCVFLATMLHGKSVSQDGSSGPEFAEVFIIYWFGAAVVTLNIKLLGGSISFFQSICVLGYCVLPLAVALITSKLLTLVDHTQGGSTWVFVIRCVIILLAFAWSTFASTAFLADCQPPKRKPLAVYPIFLFYFFIGWLILSHN
jgi:hypothetical protein